MTRPKEYEMQAADARRRWENMRQIERSARSNSAYAPAPRRANTLGPQEDVVESRRMTRNRVVMAVPRSATTKSILTENILLLVLLVLSIYGLYLLSVYILKLS